MPNLLDLTGKFHRFYQLAAHTDPEARWALWQEHYNFAAVPPIPEAQAMARKLLDAAWDRYATLPVDLAEEVRRLEQQVAQATSELETLFQTSAPEFRLVAYVGGFEGNAFVAGNALCLPVEMPREWLEPVVRHELAHLFHHKLSGSAGGWQRPLAALIVEEGLATRTVDQLAPELPLQNRIGELGWLSACEEVRSPLMADALPHLAGSDDATLTRFILPHPIFELERTAYALGWWLVGEWLTQGKTLVELARIPERELPEFLRQHWG